ncbi:MAG: VOC family protein, partial [Stellaceae bacterium]
MDTIEAPAALRPQELLARLPSRLHHNAYVVKDHEANRRFFEDVLGIPLVATWCEKNFSAELQREVEFCHT